MKTKEEAIKQAWANNIPNGGIDENGWSKKSIRYEYFDIKDYDSQNYLEGAYIRPKSLKGIENNNGWIKIKDGLPKTDGWYHCIYNDEEKMYIFNGITFVNALGIKREVTHYKTIIKPLKPLY